MIKTTKTLISLFIILTYFAKAQKASILPKPEWVKLIELPNDNVDTKKLSDGYYYFLGDQQVNVSKKHYYYHYAYKIYNAKGLENSSTLYFSYNPSYEKLQLHSIKIKRGKEQIEKAKTSKLTLLQREAKLEQNIYDERLTLSTVLEDVRVGDIIEYEYSLIGDNPIFNDKFYYNLYANLESDYKLLHYRVLKPKNKNFILTYLNDKIEPTITTENGMECLTWSIADSKGHTIESGAPDFYNPYNIVEISEYESWSQVAEWAKNVFKTSGKPSKELQSKIDEFKKLQAPKVQVMEALHFIQNEIRYFGVEIGINSHKPRNPNEVFKARYGDCKDKVQLYCYILNELKIYARPVLVNTNTREKFTDYAVSPHQFDHVIAEVVLDGYHYYFDPTINFQEGNLSNYYTPNYGAGLVIGDSAADIIRFPPTNNVDSKLKEHFIIHSTKGDASLNSKTFYHGYNADYYRSIYANTNNYEIAENYKTYYKKLYGDLSSVGEVVSKDSKINNIFSISENYKFSKIWNDSTEKKGNSAVTFFAHFISEEINKIDISKESRKDPLYIPYPSILQHIIDVDLPDDWNIDKTPVYVDNKHFSYSKKLTYITNTRKLSINYTFTAKLNNVSPGDYKEFRSALEKVKNDLYYTLTYNQNIATEVKSSSTNWLMIFVSLFVILLMLIVIHFIHKKAFKIPENTEVPRSLSGFLLLPFIGLCGLILLTIISLINGVYYNKQSWLLYTDENSQNYLNGFAEVVIFELAMQLFAIVFSGYIIFLMIKYSHLVPKLMVAHIIVGIVYNIADSICSQIVLGNTNILSSIFKIFICMCIGGVFIPYFLTSDQSKETFIK